MISPNLLIGSSIYKTSENLSKNRSFMSNVVNYPFHEDCVIDGKLSLWHYPGTPNEIANTLTNISKDNDIDKLVKFPSFFTFHPIRQDINGSNRIIHFNLAITAKTHSKWTTRQREKYVFDTLLRPIYNEFIDVVSRSVYFKNLSGVPPHAMYENYTTGGKEGLLIERYGDNIDAIEIHNLALTVNPLLCERDFLAMEAENSKILQRFNDLK